MATLMHDDETEALLVIHPLDDVAEEKCNPDLLPKLHLTLGGKIALIALRSYLIVMLLLVLYRVVDLAGVFGH